MNIQSDEIQTLDPIWSKSEFIVSKNIQRSEKNLNRKTYTFQTNIMQKNGKTTKNPNRIRIFAKYLEILIALENSIWSELIIFLIRADSNRTPILDICTHLYIKDF